MNNTREKSLYDYEFISRFLFTKKYFSYLLAAPTLVALTPPGHEVRIFDENIGEVDFSWPAELVGISVRTMFANRAYELADMYRAKGVKTVLGGIHPSMCTEEALAHSDSVVVGEAEQVWAAVVADAEAGTLKRTYQAEGHTDLTLSPRPCREALAQGGYFADIVQTTKGCPFHCEFCSVHAYDGMRIRHKTVEQVVREVLDVVGGESGVVKRKSLFFADDNIIADRKFARELFTALRPYKLNFSCQASINVAEDDEMLGLMKQCGCGAILIGFESISSENLGRMDKGVNLKRDYASAIRRIQDHGMLVHASFIVGYDFETERSMEELADFIEEADILMPLINILTPFPGTKLFKRFEEEGRILHKDWSLYDTRSVVFKPALITGEQLLEGHRKVLRRVYSLDSILRKLNKFWDMDFWKHSNEVDPIKFRYRFLFALRLATLMFSTDFKRTGFIAKVMPRVLFDRRVRISTLLSLMSYNHYAYHC